jgi:hypothetical protein
MLVPFANNALLAQWHSVVAKNPTVDGSCLRFEMHFFQLFVNLLAADCC